MKSLILVLICLISVAASASSIKGTWFSDASVEAVNGGNVPVKNLSLNIITFNDDNTYVNQALFQGVLIIQHGKFHLGESLTLIPNSKFCNGAESFAFETSYEVSEKKLTYIFNYEGSEYRDTLEKADPSMLERFNELIDSSKIVTCY